MGINVDASLRLTKFIQQDTTNSKHNKSLAQTIFTTPNMTLSRATSSSRHITQEEILQQREHPPSTLYSAGTVRQKGHAIQSCTKKTKYEQKKKRKPQTEEKPRTSPHKKKKWRFTCAICDSTDHSSFKCPKREVARTAAAGSKTSHSVHWGADEHSSEDDPS
jgi:hypothetical protein